MPEARHILSCASATDAGGVERALFRLAAGWAAAGRQVTIAMAAMPAEVPAGVELVPLARLWRLPGLARRVRPDLIFCPGNHYTSLMAWTRWRLGRDCPSIVAKMSNAARRGDHGAVVDRLHRGWLASHGRFLDHLVAMTPATASAAAEATGMAGRVGVIPNPPVAPRADAPPVALPPGPLVLGVGRLVRQKRWDRLVDALPRLATRASLVILGDGPEREALAAQARALGVARRVHLPGSVADPLGAMARAPVLALPSDYEGVPGVLREALSVGTPVVATDCSPAIEEIVASPALGSVVARGDPNALVAALDRWLAPGVVRPTPVPPPGADAALRYLALFDRLVA